MKKLCLLLLSLLALTGAAKVDPAAKLDVVEVSSKDEPGLPRVLVIGDSVGRGYTPLLGDLLKGKANVYGTRKNAGSTLRGLEKIDEWLRDGTWDVIHFNWGIQDMLATPGGKRQAEPEEYEKNLRTLVEKMKATHALLIWATITPIPGGAGDEANYNGIARRVMGENGVAIDDLNTAVTPHLAEWQLPQDVHYKPEGYAFLAQQVAGSIAGVLPGKK